MIDLIVKWLAKLITGTFYKLLYKSKSDAARKEVQDAKANADKLEEESNGAATDFRVRLQQYRKSRTKGDLRAVVGRVRDSSGKAGADNSGKKFSDRQAGKSNKN